MNMKAIHKLVLGMACAIASAALPVHAQTNKVIRVVLPFSAGGPTDSSVRILAEAMRDYGTLVVYNKPGAGGAIAADTLRRAPADGATLGVMAVDELAINHWLRKGAQEDYQKSFAPITLIASVPNVLVISAEVSERLKIHTLADLVNYAKANPDKLTYASGGNGSIAHLLGEMLKERAGFKALHVPYQGGQPAQLALLGSQVDFAFNTLPTWANQIKAGKVRALAVTSAKRIPALPDVPTVSESYQGFEGETWWGVFAPAGTPQLIVDEAHDAFIKALNDPTTRQQFEAQMITPAPMSIKDFDAFIRQEQKHYERPAKDSGVTLN
jgi:tripartite-type tricarboxylate transporter receptor subunit TctC